MTSADRVFAQRPSGALHMRIERPRTLDPGQFAARGIVLFLHGGGWASGDRNLGFEYIEPLTHYGLTVVSADYRLTGDAPFPAQLEDATAAFDWVAGHVEELSGLSDVPLIVAGSSAGGHLAMLVGLDAGTGFTRNAATRRPDGIVTYAAVADSDVWASERARAPRPHPGTFAHRQLAAGGAWPPDTPGLVSALRDGPPSPVNDSVFTHIDPTDVETASSTPEFLLVHGSRDTCVDGHESQELFTALETAGYTASLLLVGHADHEDPVFGITAVAGSVAQFVESLIPTVTSAPQTDSPR